MSNRTICLINDSFPPVTDGVANAVVNYGRAITESGSRAVVATPAYPGADDSGFSFPVVRYPSIDMTKPDHLRRPRARAARPHPRPGGLYVPHQV